MNLSFFTVLNLSPQKVQEKVRLYSTSTRLRKSQTCQFLIMKKSRWWRKVAYNRSTMDHHFPHRTMGTKMYRNIYFHRYCKGGEHIISDSGTISANCKTSYLKSDERFPEKCCAIPYLRSNIFDYVIRCSREWGKGKKP